MSVVKGKAVCLHNVMIPVALHFVDTTWNESRRVLCDSLSADQRRLITVSGISGSGGRRCHGAILNVEAEKRVNVQVVQSGPRTKPIVSEFCVSAIARDAKVFPFGDVVTRGILSQS